MKIAVIVAGGVGGYFGGLLARNGLDVTFVARGAQYAALKDRGLTIKSIENKRPTEIEALNGALVRLAEGCGIPTPINSAIYNAVRLSLV